MRLSKLFSPFRLTLLGIAVCAATIGILLLQPQKASADQCSVNGRDCYFGYFFNGHDGGPGIRRSNVLSAPALLNVHTGIALVNTLHGHMGGCPGGVIANPNSQNATGSAFIILTMLGAPPGTPKNVACQRFIEWRDMVFNWDASGRVNFNLVHDFGGINTRSTLTDVAYYPMNGAANSIVFFNPNTGQPWYAIKKDCGNPVGQLHGLFLNYNLQAEIGYDPAGGTVEPGEPITFYYNVHNNGPTYSPLGVNCTARFIVHAGYVPTPSPPEGGGTNVPTNCPRDFPNNSIRTVATRTVTAAANTTVCATLFVTPANVGGGTTSREVCVRVVSKPYLMVFGGDVSAGGDLADSTGACTPNPNGAIVGWNRNIIPTFPGAGVQYAAFAVNTIREFSSAHNSPTGGAGMPGGLSFSSVTQNYPIGKYGGDFQAAKCIKDYYSQKPATTSSLPPNVSTMTTGAYAGPANTSVVLNGGNVNPGQKISVFIDGDLFINSNITYAGSWSYNNIPLFQLVVRGNIYIRNTVTRLDGVYIAQPKSDLTKGYVYTCATDATPPFDPPTIDNGAFVSSCGSKLTVNGSVVAREMQLLRTNGTLRLSNPGETNASNDAAEIFNYGPGFWITQPDLSTTNGGSVDNYDAITSLAPIL